MNSSMNHVIVMAIPLVWSSLILAQAQPPKKSNVAAQKVYDSPQAVFEAYRIASTNRDKRTEHLCYTPEFREWEVYQSYLWGFSILQDKTKANALRKKFGVEEKAVHDEYFNLYKIKTGIDQEKLLAEYEQKQARAVADYVRKSGDRSGAVPQSVTNHIGPPPQHDEDLFRKVVLEKINDKVVFVVAIDEALRNPKDDPVRLGDLKNLQIQGDQATGTHTRRIYGMKSVPGKKKMQQFFDDTEGPIAFRKSKDGGWLISQP